MWICFPRIRIRRINRRQGRQGKFQPIGNRCCTNRRRFIFYQSKQGCAPFMGAAEESLSLRMRVRRHKLQTFRGKIQYLRPIDSLPRLWLNERAVDWGAISTCSRSAVFVMGAASKGAVDERRANRTEEL